MTHSLLARRRIRIGALCGAVACLGLVPIAAGATVAPGEDAVALGTAAVSGATLAGAAVLVDYECVPDDPATAEDETACTTGVGSSPMAGFPTHGGTFAILTSGNAGLADDPNDSGANTHDWQGTGTPDKIPGETYDEQVVRMDLGPANGSCLAFDFKFLSEEYPEFVHAGFNDAFIAQLNTWNVSVDAATQTVIAPGNFAAGAGDQISVDAAGPSSMLPEHAVGTTYDGATLPLVARTPVAPGSVNSIYFTIFDQGDAILDSAAFVDNVRYENIPAAQCKSLALDPFEGTTGLTPTTAGPTFGAGLTTLQLPVTCTLPPGPIGCNVTAAAKFTPYGQTVARGTADRMRTTTPLATGSIQLAAGASGTLVMTATPEGIAAVKAELAKPATMQKDAKKAIKKAKKLQKKAKAAPPAKAKKLQKKAKKLLKKAKRLQKAAKQLKLRPLGTVTIALTNPSNGASQVLTFSSIKR